jgi:molybdopterin molybdotransferase
VITLDEAQARLLALAVPLPIETLSLNDAVGRWLAAPVTAKRTQPVRDLSAMDGYAIAHRDLPGPWTVIGESAAGVPFGGAIGVGQAIRIFTGAALCSGSDSIVIQEDIDRCDDRISISADVPIPCGQHVRLAGSDFQSGDTLIEAGTRLTPARLALAAMGGYGALWVGRKPRVAILSTGSELVVPGSETGDDKIPSSNAVMLAAMLANDAHVIDLGVVRDDLDALASAIRAADADILVTSGGASVGDHDLVRPALIACGAEIDFWKVAMRPGKPLMAGRIGDQLVLGLPGNPVSAFVTARLFLKPLVAALSGAGDPLPEKALMTLDGSLPGTGPRTDHVRAIRKNGRAYPIGQNDSAALKALAKADILIVRPANSPPANSGDLVQIINIT